MSILKIKNVTNKIFKQYQIQIHIIQYKIYKLILLV